MIKILAQSLKTKDLAALEAADLAGIAEQLDALRTEHNDQTWSIIETLDYPA